MSQISVPVEATELDEHEVLKHVHILEQYKIGKLDEYNELPVIRLDAIGYGWPIWDTLKSFAERMDIPLQEILVNATKFALCCGALHDIDHDAKPALGKFDKPALVALIDEDGV